MDSDHPSVIRWTREVVRDIPAGDKLAQAVSLYLAVRDSFLYNPYEVDLRPEAMKASFQLGKESGYCIEKANLLGASARVLGIPARLGFADVRNHIGTERLEAFLGTDILTFHGYTDLYLEGQWVKATPAFNAALCRKLGVEPLEFNGREDSIFQEYDQTEGRFMEYLVDHGTFQEWPREAFIASIQKHYPKLFEQNQDRPLDKNAPRL